MKAKDGKIAIVYVNPVDLKPADYNPRTMTPKEEKDLRESMVRFGMADPLIVNRYKGRENVVIGGHQRLKIALAMGLIEVPVVYLSLPEEKERELNLRLNRNLGSWDWDMVAAFDVDFLVDVGFDHQELVKRLNLPIEVDESQAPLPPDDPKTRPGNIYVLGEHRLMCGDAGSKEDLDRLCDGSLIDLLNTDPPYNVKVEPRSNNAIAAGITSFGRREDLQCSRSTSKVGQRNRARQEKKELKHHQRLMVDHDRGARGLKHHQRFDLERNKSSKKATHKQMRAKDRPLVNDFIPDAEFEKLLTDWFGNFARVMRPGCTFYVWGGYANVANYPPAFEATGLYFSQTIIWHKLHPVLTRKDFMGDHEWCFYGWKKDAAHRWLGADNVPDVWQVKKVNHTSMVHLTEKPVELAARAISYSTERGETVLDAFGGSGSTLMAAEQLGRRCLTMEIDPAYCDVIVGRWEAATGKKAKLL